MAKTTWTFEAHVTASADAVYAWMTDFREDDHARPAFVRASGGKAGVQSTRRILARAGDSVQLEDRWGRQSFRTTARLARGQREVRIEGAYGYRATWCAAPNGRGTRVTATTELDPRGFFALLLPLVAGKMRAQAEHDFRGHIADLEAELGAPR